eukprot:TRINITY_DN19345_c0_g1_i1.p1 TRINITY_DN19345_c0_g1~~TRINITY_DN19345_c0_g1_i1.p1  ORF type:complete len:714 (+),score=274.31 TRINITY_DN19345_c0_g1_i1:77-2218(+)
MAQPTAATVALSDVTQTEYLGALLAKHAAKGDVIFLKGELGAGKTALARGYTRYFFQNPDLDVPSPTYLLHFVYGCQSEAEGALEKVTELDVAAGQAKEQKLEFKAGRWGQLGPDVQVNHLDPYRLPAGRIAGLVDFESLFAHHVSLIEWPQRLGDKVEVPEERLLVVELSGVGIQNDQREARLSTTGARWRGFLESTLAPAAAPAASVFSVDAAVEQFFVGKSDAAGDPAASAHLEEALANAPVRPNAFRQKTLDSLRGRDLAARPLVVLGIESSCDDTGVAVVTTNAEVLGECLASQAQIHEHWGGVKPDAAQQAHKDAIVETVDTAVRQAVAKRRGTAVEGVTAEAVEGFMRDDVDAVAVTVGPGLSLCLSVGVEKAYALAALYQKPVVRVHHMEAHAMMARMPMQLPAAAERPAPPGFPYMTLLVSGGHNMSVLSLGLGDHVILGSTLDDSVGEAFDKTARLLGITKIPGGPHLERMALDGGNDKRFQLPKPLATSRNMDLRRGCDFSYSGLKTAVKLLCTKEILPAADGDAAADAANKQTRSDIAAVFQRVAVGHLVERAGRAVDAAREYLTDRAGPDGAPLQLTALIVAGGVAANKSVRAQIGELAVEKGLQLLVPHPRYCVDNGVMVAWTGVERLRLGMFDEPPRDASKVALYSEIRPKWPLGPRDMRWSKDVKGEHAAKMKRKRADKAAAAAGHESAPKKPRKAE